MASLAPGLSFRRQLIELMLMKRGTLAGFDRRAAAFFF